MGESRSISNLQRLSMNKHDFIFRFVTPGHYKVTYISPITGKSWTRVVTDMTLIDDIRFQDNPKIKKLEELKRLIKQ